MNKQPNYQKLYKEITERFHKEKSSLVTGYLEKEEWTSLDVITVNDLLFNKKRNKELEFNAKCKAYDELSIKNMLNYQKQHRLNNTDRKSTRLNSSHVKISYAVFCLKKKRKKR